MPNNDFFEQLISAVAKTGSSGRCMPDSKAWKEFLTDTRKRAEVPVQSAVQVPERVLSAPVPEPQVPAPEKVILPGSLDARCSQALSCRNCPLCERRTNVVFGEGNPDARLMFIGEAPGYEEDMSGRPFVGAAGQLLDKMIKAMNFSREEVYIANIIKCRPKDNRTPAPDEISVCIPFLHQQIRLIRPEVIICLGATAAKALLNTANGISRMRGKWCNFENIPVMPTFHPAFLLRQESAKRDAWNDLKLVMAYFAGNRR